MIDVPCKVKANAAIYRRDYSMKVDRRSKIRESKRIENTLIKYRDKIDEPLKSEDSKREAFSALKSMKTPTEDGKVRVYHEFLNRTRRKREALRYEVSASGENFLEAA